MPSGPMVCMMMPSSMKFTDDSARFCDALRDQLLLAAASTKKIDRDDARR